MMMDDIEEGVGMEKGREFNERELKEGGRKRYSRMVLPYKNNSCWIDYYDLFYNTDVEDSLNYRWIDGCFSSYTYGMYVLYVLIS